MKLYSLKIILLTFLVLSSSKVLANSKDGFDHIDWSKFREEIPVQLDTPPANMTMRSKMMKQEMPSELVEALTEDARDRIKDSLETDYLELIENPLSNLITDSFENLSEVMSGINGSLPRELHIRPNYRLIERTEAEIKNNHRRILFSFGETNYFFPDLMIHIDRGVIHKIDARYHEMPKKLRKRYFFETRNSNIKEQLSRSLEHRFEIPEAEKELQKLNVERYEEFIFSGHFEFYDEVIKARARSYSLLTSLFHSGIKRLNEFQAEQVIQNNISNNINESLLSKKSVLNTYIPSMIISLATGEPGLFPGLVLSITMGKMIFATMGSKERLNKLIKTLTNSNYYQYHSLNKLPNRISSEFIADPEGAELFISEMKRALEAYETQLNRITSLNNSCKASAKSEF